MYFYDDDLEFGVPYRVVFIRRETTPYCGNILAVDLDTGVVLVDKPIGDFEGAFTNGYSACVGEVVISREESPNGAEYRTASDLNNGSPCCNGWMGGSKPQGTRKRGGKKSYIKLHPEKLAELPDSLLANTVRLSGYINVGGDIINPKNRRSLDLDDLAKIWGVENRRAYVIIGKLKDSGVMENTEKGYRINRDYLGRG